MSLAPPTTIRPLSPEDADLAAQLCEELGYPVPPPVMRARIESVAALRDHALFAACVDGNVVGWVDVGIVYHLQSGVYGEIGGLVVASAQRGRGIGRQLLAYAEAWIASKGVARVVVRSQIKREDAHRFYCREGYASVKTSVVFSKTLTGASR